LDPDRIQEGKNGPQKKNFCFEELYVLLGGLKCGILAEVEKIPDHGSGSTSKNLSILTPKIVYKLKEI
jgi:hypothetical protein